MAGSIEQRVFGTRELMEMILSFVPPQSLLRVQAVNSEWRDGIQGSSILQQRLFYKPEKINKIWLVEITNLPAQQRPLPRAYPSKMRVLAEVSHNDSLLKGYRGLIATPVRVNPLFLSSDIYHRDPKTVDVKVDRAFVAEYSADVGILKTISHHSIRDMFLTQPPVTSLSLEVLVERRPLEDIDSDSEGPIDTNVDLHCAKITEPDGIRIHHVTSVIENRGILNAVTSIKLFMCGVVEPTDEDRNEVRRRTEKWHRAKETGLQM